jgi:hypothetical protein
MKRCEGALLRLNELFKWSNDGFLYEGTKCSINDMNSGLRKIGRDNRCRFKPGIIIDDSDSDSDDINNNTEDDETSSNDGSDNSTENNNEDTDNEDDITDNNNNENNDDINDNDNDVDGEGSDDEEEEEEEEEEEAENVKLQPSYSCPICATSFVFMNQLSTHMKVTHTQNPSKFTQSSTNVIKSDNASETIKQHDYNVKPIISQNSACSICDQKFTNSYNMMRHMRTQHSSKKFKCPSCERLFARLDTMKLHMCICKKKSSI